MARAPTEIVLDGIVRICFPLAATGPPAAPAPYLTEQVAGGLRVTAPDGSRLLCAAGPGAVPHAPRLAPGAVAHAPGDAAPSEAPCGAWDGAPDDAAPYDIALLDLLGDPAQLGALRWQGLVTDATVVAVIHVDHRLPDVRELARRCGFWRVSLAADGAHFTVHPQPAHPRPAQPQPVQPQPAHAQPAHAQSAHPQPAHPPPAHPPPAQPRPWQAQPPHVQGALADQYLPGTAGELPRPWRVLVLGGARSGKSAEAERRLAAEAEVTYVAAGSARGDDPDWAARVAAHLARRPRWWRTVETTDVARVLRANTGAVLIDSIGSWLAAVLDDVGAWRHPPGDPQVMSRLRARISELADAWRDTRSYVVAVSEEAGSGVVPGTPSGRMFRDELGSLNQLLAAESEEAVLVVAGRALSLPG